MYVSPDIARLSQLGVHFPGAMDWLTPEVMSRIAMDAEPSIVTPGNGGIPDYLNTYVDPQLIDVLFAPNRAVDIVGEEVQKGSWVTPTAVFIQTESTGEVSSYGDFNQNGVTGVNPTFPQRQNYVYQTMINYGDRESEEYGLARINLANEKRKSAALVLNKFQNVSYFNGVSGLQNYGLLNDPSLSASLTPGSGTWTSQPATGGTAIYNDVNSMYKQLQVQTSGLVTREDELTLAMSPETEVNLLKLAAVGSPAATGVSTNVFDLLKKAYPNMKIKTAVQYTTGSGELVQLIANRLDGNRTAVCGYSEKLRAHRIVQETSSFHQKMSQGTWGTIIYRPLAIASMLGV